MTEHERAGNDLEDETMSRYLPWTVLLIATLGFSLHRFPTRAQENSPANQRQSGGDVENIRAQLSEILGQIGEKHLISDFAIPAEFQTPKVETAAPPEEHPLSTSELVLRCRKAELDLMLARRRLEQCASEVAEIRRELESRFTRALAESGGAPFEPLAPGPVMNGSTLPRYAVISMGNRTAILVDQFTGRTWRMSPHQTRWTPLPREGHPPSQ